MEMSAILHVLSPSILLLIGLGVAGGIVIGALPGLTATMGVALLIPITFGMDAVAGMSMLMGIFCGGFYGGCISATLVKTPGTPASAATTLDAYPMAQKGEAGRALGMATVASFIGGIFSAIVLVFLAPQLVKVALMFGPAEYFALAVFGLTIIATLSVDLLHGLIIGCFGMLLSTVGSDPISGFNRFTFDIANLGGGIAFIPALIGLFAISEVLEQLNKLDKGQVNLGKITRVMPSLKDLRYCLKTILRGSFIGTTVGIIPGTGPNIAAWISYNEARRASKTPEKFGTGFIDGVAATESANNAVCGGALVPLITLGIPGDTVTAVLIGGLMIHGLVPGPRLFVEHPDIVTGLFTGFFIANFFMLFIGLLAVKYATKVLNIPKRMLLAAIVVFCFVGSYSINGNPIDIIVMLAFGVIGYLCQRYRFSLPALCIAMVLGPIAENNLRLALIDSNLDPLIFFTRPISLTFMILSMISLSLPIYKSMKKHWKEKKAQ